MPSAAPSQPLNLDGLREGYFNSSLKDGIYLGDPTAHRKTRWLPMEGAGADGHVLAVSGEDEVPSPASLLAVLRITSEDNWTMPDGNWKGPREFAKHFADVKLTCTGAQPRSGVFRGDYAHVIDNLKSIQDMIAVAGCEKKKGLLAEVKRGDPSGGLKIKLQHALFQEKKHDDDDDAAESEDGEASDAVPTIENWPTSHPKAKNALAKMKDTHDVIPLLLYKLPSFESDRSKLVQPQDYCRCLSEAIVEVRFQLTHWRLKKTDEEVFSAHIQDMCLLPVPAMALPSPVRKRPRVDAEHPCSPSKRMKLGSIPDARA
ncbi:uncharacterized protein EV420DRAFT_1527822 [Desarmillaria tabescens]|uniref:Uncharacterized protein n=1 Tax=Armillaria tabescens TaxID=1929756 RepID=A0AA39TS15_ARMTA|nr:uncharacterized protein EV420DRAFT_1527822 [Desarmillaria tabescens]KAK0461894.1 hypothetical protein EV420DRAFT_1527822 [Desarmillaria tabescens]